jgi:cysteine synthase
VPRRTAAVDEPVSALRRQAYTNTPLCPVDLCDDRGVHSVWLKLEQYNPTGSIKYRTAVGLLAALDRARPLRPGTRIVESTSGNLGLALARVAARQGCRFLAVVDPKVAPATRALLTAAGAELVAVHDRDAHGGYLLTRLAVLADLCRADPGLRWTDQYDSPANPSIHRHTLAPELLWQTGGAVDAVFVAVGTGGTLAGISECLRARAPAARVYAVDVHGSRVLAGEGSPHLLTGIGASRKSSFLRPCHYERSYRVFDVEAFAYSRMLARDTGLAVGGSSGAVLAAYHRAGRAQPAAFRCPVAVVPDAGTRYRATFYDDRWLAERGALAGVLTAEAAARAHGLAFHRGALTGGVVRG